MLVGCSLARFIGNQILTLARFIGNQIFSLAMFVGYQGFSLFPVFSLFAGWAGAPTVCSWGAWRGGGPLPQGRPVLLWSLAGGPPPLLYYIIKPKGKPVLIYKSIYQHVPLPLSIVTDALATLARWVIPCARYARECPLGARWVHRKAPPLFTLGLCMQHVGCIQSPKRRGLSGKGARCAPLGLFIGYGANTKGIGVSSVVGRLRAPQQSLNG